MDNECRDRRIAADSATVYVLWNMRLSRKKKQDLLESPINTIWYRRFPLTQRIMLGLTVGWLGSTIKRIGLIATCVGEFVDAI